MPTSHLTELRIPDGTHVCYRAWNSTSNRFCTPMHEYVCLRALQRLQSDIQNSYPAIDLWSAILEQMTAARTYPSKLIHPLLATFSPMVIVDAQTRKQLNDGIQNVRSIVNAVDSTQAAKGVVETVRKHQQVEIAFCQCTYTLPFRVYHRIREQYNAVSNCDHPIDNRIWMGIHRYTIFKLYNNAQGSTTEKHYNLLRTRVGTSVEGFGSFFNHTLPNYFGLFPDIEHPFGCLGNAFHAELYAGFYVVNPPFTTQLMNRTIEHVRQQMTHARGHLRVLLVLPTWVNDERRQLNKICWPRLKIQSYRDTVDTAELRNDPNTLQYALYCKNHYTYHSYLTDRPTCFCATTTVLMSNRSPYDGPLTAIVNRIMGKPTYVWNHVKGEFTLKHRKSRKRTKKTSVSRRDIRKLHLM